MRPLHALQHLHEEHYPFAWPQSSRLGMLDDGRADHVFQRQVGLSLFGDTSVVQARDVPVFQPRQDVAFARETLDQLSLRQDGEGQLEGHVALESAVDALGQPDRTHAAPAQQPQQSVGAELPAGFDLRCQVPFGHKLHQLGQPGQQALRWCVGLLQQQAVKQRAQILDLERQAFQPLGPLRRRQVQRLFEQCRQPGQVSRSERHRILVQPPI